MTTSSVLVGIRWAIRDQHRVTKVALLNWLISVRARG
jgi:hypothetical protein